MPVNDDVESISLHVKRPLWLHAYIAPFLVIYLVWLYGAVVWIGLSEHWELTFILLAAIGIVQILVSLSCFWSVHINCAFTCRKETDVLKATHAKVIPTPNNGFPELVPLMRQPRDNAPDEIWFYFQKMKYLYDIGEKKQFTPIEFPIDKTMGFYQSWKGYQTEAEVMQAQKTYGNNRLQIEPPDFWTLFSERATAPFFVFQVFCVGLWCLDEYWYYSIFTLIMLVIFECTLVKQQQRNLSMIRDMGSKPYPIMTHRDRKWRYVQTDELAPGDLVSIGRPKDNDVVPCDLLLLRGSCIVDESMLTGESVPQMKEPVETLSSGDVLDLDRDKKLHVLFGGTKVVQHTPVAKGSEGIRPNDSGCLAYVLRTGFNTSQGKLLRTIIYSVKRVTANNLESFCFILFLLIFAICSASYVWIKGSENPDRNRYKLFLECTLILTSVVPPELPIELSLAVNTSLMALVKLGIYCTEPFRIPCAGKLDVCCFDKTGTLTSDDLVVRGVAGLNGDSKMVDVCDVPHETLMVLVSCHSLMQMDDALVGDPVEKAALKSTDWSLSRGDIVTPRKGKRQSLKILQRFHFSSALKRMSSISSYQSGALSSTSFVATVKGAPETLRTMLKQVPDHYDSVHLEMSRQGARVLALAYKQLPEMSGREVRSVARQDIESNLEFAGFLIIDCPLKKDSKSIIKNIRRSAHHVTMITGDSPLTACHVAKELEITKRTTLMLIQGSGEWQWEAVDGSVSVPILEGGKAALVKDYDLCLTGGAMNFLINSHKKYLNEVLPSVKVFARVSPKQKEHVITSLRNLGCFTLMCGDGTNDVGALKHAHVGVALLSSVPLRKAKPRAASEESSVDPSESEQSRSPDKSSLEKSSVPAEPRIMSSSKLNRIAKMRAVNQGKPTQTKPNHYKHLNQLAKELDEMELHVVRLGDASIASPFTSKSSSIECVTHIIKQGRCTLVTTLQMFKILALNALILAYSQSVLYLDGIKFSDAQATLQGMLLAACFLFISRSKPLTELSKRRPMPNIFNLYTVLTVLLQFGVHFTCLVYLVLESKKLSPPREEEFIDLEKKFEMNILNSTVYLIGMTMQVTTFAVNYKGHPFMASLRENKPLMISILLSFAAIAALAAGFMPDLASQLEIVEFPSEFQTTLMMVLFLDFAVTFVVDRTCEFLLGHAKLRRL
ncbi:endoplasmic reticulum transmembrane helix translocase-like [Corticium candelabrum]|uniref:endoplasmic reticulum transmembrane helix translocase-like n=1 Tax=Corticium candelabrum TaxID=121492 RepID=UPI002E2552E9|nr:endoplasmic reticulum transmembrane helix translocase-like [Corticium candelabrum]